MICLTLYGIKNCDTCRKARKWLEQEGVPHNFHDFRDNGLVRTQIESWIAEIGWEKLLNRRSTTWRNLPESDKANITQETAINLILTHPALVKRPVIELANTCFVGFDKGVMEKICREL